MPKAQSYLESLLAKHEFPPGSRIPSLRELAAAAEISTQAMNEAVQAYCKTGQLKAHRGRGIFVAGEKSPEQKQTTELNQAILNSKTQFSEKNPPRKRKGDRLRQALELAILEQRFDSALPDPETLCRQFAVSQPTLRKALAALEKEGVLRQEGRQWIPVASQIQPPHASLLFVAAGDSLGQIQIQNFRQEELLASLEKACGNSRLNLIHCAISPEMELERSVVPYIRSPVWRGEPIAALIWRTALMASTVTDLISALTKGGRPVVLVDEMGDWRPLSQSTRLPMLCFAIAGYQAGYGMGKSLLLLGHRQVAYFSVFHSHFWSQERLRGLKMAFAEAGFESGVKAFCTDHDDRLNPTNPRVRMDRDDFEILHRTSELLELVERQSVLVPFKSYEARLAMDDLVRFTRVNAYLQPLFNDALQQNQITAWVGASDIIAYFALKQLRQNEIKVPEQISVVGFDNARWAMECNLTTYSFNFPELARAALAWLLTPDSKRQAEPRFRRESPGVIIDRQTSGPVK